MKISLESLLNERAIKMLDFSSDDGIQAGFNGPYHDTETPVRNTAHWLITFSFLYKRSQDDKFKKAAYKAIKYLQSKSARPMNGAFFCRQKIEKDFSNGLMGQAWVIEALLYAYNIFLDEELYQLAESVFMQHVFDEDRALWYRLGVDGSRMSFDDTFNHQLWFCAVGSMLFKTPEALKVCDHFFNKIATKPQLYKDGVLYHKSSLYSFEIERRKGLKSLIEFLYLKLSDIRQKEKLYLKSVGYHGFNLYAFELLKSRYSDSGFFESKKYKRMLNAVLKANFRTNLLKSDYSYGYNPPGFEIGFALKANGFKDELVVDVLEEHFKHTYTEDGFNSKVSADERTSEARLYELVRLLDLGDVNVQINR